MRPAWSSVARRWPRTTGRPCTHTSVTAWWRHGVDHVLEQVGRADGATGARDRPRPGRRACRARCRPRRGRAAGRRPPCPSRRPARRGARVPSRCRTFWSSAAMRISSKTLRRLLVQPPSVPSPIRMPERLHLGDARDAVAEDHVGRRAVGEAGAALGHQARAPRRRATRSARRSCAGPARRACRGSRMGVAPCSASVRCALVLALGDVDVKLACWPPPRPPSPRGSSRARRRADCAARAARPPARRRRARGSARGPGAPRPRASRDSGRAHRPSRTSSRASTRRMPTSRAAWMTASAFSLPSSWR